MCTSTYTHIYICIKCTYAKEYIKYTTYLYNTSLYPSTWSSKTLCYLDVYIYYIYISLYIYYAIYRILLVGGFNPSEKCESTWKSSPNRGENKKYLKPPPRYLLCYIPYITYPSPYPQFLLTDLTESSSRSRWLQNRWKDGEVVLSEVEAIGFLMVKWYGSNPSSWGFKGGWLVDLLLGWLAGCLVGWVITVVDWLVGWLVCWLVGWLFDWLIDWLIDWLLSLFKSYPRDGTGETYWNTNAPEVTRFNPHRGGWRFGVKIYSYISERKGGASASWGTKEEPCTYCQGFWKCIYDIHVCSSALPCSCCETSTRIQYVIYLSLSEDLWMWRANIVIEWLKILDKSRASLRKHRLSHWTSRVKRR